MKPSLTSFWLPWAFSNYLNPIPMSVLWIVMEYKQADYGPDYTSVASLWPTREEADAEAARLNHLHKADFIPTEYEVEEVEVGRDYSTP